jgi:hypothetical protein
MALSRGRSYSRNRTELNVVRDMLIQRMHHHFSSPPNSLENHVPLRASVPLVFAPSFTDT